MKRALAIIGVLATGLVIALVLRVRHLQAASHGPAGGTGVIEGVDVNVTSRIATRITNVLVREGDTVREGQLLVELDCTEQSAALEGARDRVQAAQASLEAARAGVQAAVRTVSAGMDNVTASRSQLAVLQGQEALARLELARTERLVQSGALSREMLDDARVRHDTLVNQITAQRASAGATQQQAGALSSNGAAARAQVQAAEDTLAIAQADVVRAEVSARECHLLAPRQGMVVTRAIEPGEPVQPGSVVLTITDVTEARSRFYLPNNDLAAAAPGRPVRVVADAYPGQTFRGTIFYVSPQAEFTPRNVQTREDRERLVYAVEVRIPNTDLRLRSGMPVEVAIAGSWR